LDAAHLDHFGPCSAGGNLCLAEKFANLRQNTCFGDETCACFCRSETEENNGAECICPGTNAFGPHIKTLCDVKKTKLHKKDAVWTCVSIEKLNNPFLDDNDPTPKLPFMIPLLPADSSSFHIPQSHSAILLCLLCSGWHHIAHCEKNVRDDVSGLINRF